MKGNLSDTEVMLREQAEGVAVQGETIELDTDELLRSETD